MAAVGTARMAPGMPSSLPPISSATITVTALTPTCRDITFGTRTWFSICCCTTKKITTSSDLLQRHRGGDGDRRNRRQDRADDRDHLADPGDQRQHVEEGNAEQPQADRRRRADDAGEEQLAAEPRADLCRDRARHRVHAGAIAARERAAAGTAAASRLDQQVERQDQDRQQAEDPAGDADERREDRPADGLTARRRRARARPPAGR